MLQVQEAVRRSLNTFIELFPNAELQDLRLEEVSLSPDESSWLVTVSYKNPDYKEEQEDHSATSTGLSVLLGNYRGVSRRLNKTIKLRADNGEFVGIKSAWEN
jgi:hypothetical protein